MLPEGHGCQYEDDNKYDYPMNQRGAATRFYGRYFEGITAKLRGPKGCGRLQRRIGELAAALL